MSAININGKLYETYLDSEKILRFKENNLLRKIVISKDIKTSDIVKLCELEAISRMDLLDYYTGIGFTVSGVQELSFFEDYRFIKVVK